MPLSLFCDALPYSEMLKNYKNWFNDIRISPLMPNIAYSSSLHWQLYCNKYPDDRGVLVDWTYEPEKSKVVRGLSTILRPLDFSKTLGWLSRKFLDRIIFRRNVFANIPYRFRKDFSEKAKYLFWSVETYSHEEMFQGYTVVSQDEGHKSFGETIEKLNATIESGKTNIFGVFGFADSIGHQCQRGDEYSKRLKTYMDIIKKSIERYLEMHPNEPVLIVSDHGMSTVNNFVDLHLEKKFGKQSKKTYIAYLDSAFLCVWSKQKILIQNIKKYLQSLDCGHLLTEDERKKYRVTNNKFGELIFILREGNVFKTNWFGKSGRKPSKDGMGMHGFWPEEAAKDQIASVVLINSREQLFERYNYSEVYSLIKKIMCEE